MATSTNSPSIVGDSPAAVEVQRVPHRRRAFIVRFLRRKPLGALGALVLIIFFVVALTANFIAPFGFNDADPINAMLPPSLEHLFSTDQLGRDVFSRMVYGARLSVIIAVSASALSMVVSVGLGVVAGYFGGKVDSVTQRFVDAWMSFPDLIVLIVGVSVLGPGMFQLIMLLGMLYGIAGSRIIRGSVLSARERLFVQAGHSFGASNWHVIRWHVLPTIVAPMIVLFTTRLGSVILAESGLSFLGLGVPPPAPSWGGMLSDSRSYMFQNPWLVVAPGLAITLVVYSVNVFGDALRDVLDPRQRGKSGRIS
jgi:peptide/nickel transport system permease protein